MNPMTTTGDQLFATLQRLPFHERERFFALLNSKAFGIEENLSHEELFGHLENAEFTATEAADYLEISMPTFRRYLRAGKITVSSTVGNNHCYSLKALRELKKAMKMVRA